MDNQIPEMPNIPMYQQPPVYHTEPPKKKSHLGLILGIVAALLVVGIGVAAALLLQNPMTRLARGAARTGNAFADQYEAMPNLKAVAENYAALAEADTGSSSIRLLVPMEDENFLAELRLGTNIPEKVLDIQLAMGVQNVGSVRANAEVENRALRLSLPQLLPSRVLTMDLGEKAEPGDSPLFPDQSEAIQAITEKLEAYAASFQATKDGKETVAEQEWVRYTLSGDAEKKTALIDEIVRIQREAIEFSTSAIPDELGGDEIAAMVDEMETEIRSTLNKLQDPVVYMNRGGYLCGLRLSYEGSDKDVCLLLLGEENPWSDVRVTAGDEDIFTISNTVNDGKITTTITVDGQSVTMSYSDADGAWALDLQQVLSGLKLTGTLIPQNSGLALTTDVTLPQDMPTIHLEMDASAQVPQRLEFTGTEVDIMSLMDMSSEEGAALLDELQNSLLSNEELLNLVLWLSGTGMLDGLL